jgi:glycogen debranching enzyme
MSRDSLDAVYSRLLEKADGYYEQRVEHARKIREGLASVHTPDEELDLALEWAKVNMDEALACNPDLGCGLVAGYGPSGRGRRPGFGWFFGGDASINILGILPYGGFELARAGLEFQARNRRDGDGKMPHEITQSASRTREDWYRDFPYAYYHADTTPYWIVALWQYWLQTGDTDFVREYSNALRDSYRWVVEHDSDGDGIVDNTAGGLGAVEVGAIGAGLHQDIYLAGVSVESLRAVADLAAAIGDTELAQEASGKFQRAKDNLEREYFIADEEVYAFGVLEGGSTNSALTVWPATAMSFGLLDGDHAQNNLDALASHRLLADWGARMLDSDHKLYDPLQYNMGTVWGFVTGFASWALFNYDRPHAGYAALLANARSTFQFALGRNPELMSGAFFRTLDTTVPHQFFATSMIPTPLYRGLLGLTADAPHNSLDFAPNLPANWDSVSVLRYPVGHSRLDIRIVRLLKAIREGPEPTLTNVLIARFVRSGDSAPIDIRFAPELPPGSEILEAEVNGRSERLLEAARGERFSTSVIVDDSASVSITYNPGIAVVPRRPHPPVGYAIAALRIIDYRYDERTGEYVLRVEGRGGREYGIDLISPRGAPSDLHGARLRESGGVEFQLRALIEGPADRYQEKTIRFKNP